MPNRAKAQARGLVDELGGLDVAVALAKSRAKIPDDSPVELVVYPPKKSVIEMLSESLTGAGDEAAASAWLAANLSGAELDVLRTMRGPSAMFRRGEPLALMPLSFVR